MGVVNFSLNRVKCSSYGEGEELLTFKKSKCKDAQFLLMLLVIEGG